MFMICQSETADRWNKEKAAMSFLYLHLKQFVNYVKPENVQQNTNKYLGVFVNNLYGCKLYHLRLICPCNLVKSPGSHRVKSGLKN